MLTVLPLLVITLLEVTSQWEDEKETTNQWSEEICAKKLKDNFKCVKDNCNGRDTTTECNELFHTLNQKCDIKCLLPMKVLK